jgi:hypothetical protein
VSGFHIELERWNVWPFKGPFDLITQAEKEGYRGWGFVLGLYHVGSIWVTVWFRDKGQAA